MSTMLPFTSSIDLLYAGATVVAVIGLAVVIYLLARSQKPAQRPLEVFAPEPQEAVAVARADAPAAVQHALSR